MKNLILTTTAATILLLTSCESGIIDNDKKEPLPVDFAESGTIGKYKKEPLPADFTYKIIEDNSDEAVEKNQLTIEINRKISVEQIATLADKLFHSKPKQRRFYIFIMLPGMKVDVSYWAVSHFDPELEIDIIGSSTQQDLTTNKLVNEKIDGEIIGKWHEEQYTSSSYIFFKKNNKVFIKTIYKNGQIGDKELIETKAEKGTRYDHKDWGYNGEYFIVTSDGILEFYNSENKRFTTATQNK